ncbi:MAG: ferrous iron transporter B [Lachnospiraceae bacterium]
MKSTITSINIPSSHKVVAIAGNPNVGKSTLFNGLTGLNQHTGNWPGKTVASAQGCCQTASHSYTLVDIPGTYSLLAHSTEEEVARNFLCFGKPDAVIVVCDAGCLERNMNLVLQILELSSHVIVCVNLLDEAKRRNIQIDLDGISKHLGIPVIGTIARKKKSLSALLDALDVVVDSSMENPLVTPFQVTYPAPIEEAISILTPALSFTMSAPEFSHLTLPIPWLSLKLLEQDSILLEEVFSYLQLNLLKNESILAAYTKAQEILYTYGINANTLKDQLVSSLVLSAEKICADTVSFPHRQTDETDRKIDNILTSKWGGYPVMLALLALIFWITMVGANYPSRLLASGLFWFQDQLTLLFHFFHAPQWLHGMLILGVYRVLAWVVSVMLPPMAIFFPLFTLLEDSGYLPRIAYNLDKPFRKCCSCGKQSLTMCMEFVSLYSYNVIFKDKFLLSTQKAACISANGF